MTANETESRGASAYLEITLEIVGGVLLWVVWGCVVFALTLYLFVGLIHIPLSLLPTENHNHAGVGLAAVPLAAIAGGVVAGGSWGNSLRRAWRSGPLLAASVLAALVVFWFWIGAPEAFGGPEAGPKAFPTWVNVLARASGSLLAAAFAFLGMVYWPRPTAILAGVIAGPTLFGMMVLAFPGTLFHRFDEAQWGVMGWSTFGFSVAMFTLALACNKLRWWPNVLSYAVCSGSVTLVATMTGYLIGFGGFPSHS